MMKKAWIVLIALSCGCLHCMAASAQAREEPTTPSKQPKKDFVARYIAESKKGYVPRPCGFDMNRNGVIGEPADRLVGDGVTADPDGDGVDEDILYVDAKAGSDEAGDGSPAKPYKTVQKALDTCDGPEDGAEDIVCISGVFHEAIKLTQGGLPGHCMRDGFEFPSNPTMIIGWDKDGDGEYPPYDRDDEAVLDGQNKLPLAINNRPNGVAYFEIAHLTIRDYRGTSRRGNCGAIVLRGPSKAEAQSHLYVHDVVFRRINKQTRLRSSAIVVNFFPGRNGRPYLSHVAFVNNLIDEYSSFCFRGSNRIRGPLRFQNNTLKMYGPEVGTGWKLWGEINGIEILDNVVDGNPRAWKAKKHTSGATICQCTRDVTVRGNLFLDLGIGVVVKGEGYPPYSGCQSRTVDDVVIDRNIIRNTYNGYAYPPHAIIIRGAFRGAPATSSVEDVAITNNFISSTMGWNAGILVRNGNFVAPQVGTLTIAGNTIVGPFGAYGNSFAQHGISIYPQYPYRPQSFVIKNNIIAKSGGVKRNVGVNYAPANWIAEGNVYDPAAGFIWDNEIVNFERWQELTGQDKDSTQYRPAFVDEAHGDLHLTPEDTVARTAGVNITDITKVDFDGHPRSATQPVAGADVPAVKRDSQLTKPKGQDRE